MLNWGHLGVEKFNNAVNMLIKLTVERDNPGLVVEALDGRGGDGGIDLDVKAKRTGQLVRIYQLKYFPEGFSGEWGKARKPQIKKSFDAAMAHDPPKWVLVTPRDYTPKERSFVTSLRQKKPKPLIERIGVNELNLMLAQFPEIEDYLNRDATFAALERVQRESALLTRREDLHAEVRQLEKRIVASRGQNWGTSFSNHGGRYTEMLYPLHQGAAEREPLGITLATDFSGNVELGQKYQRVLDYGLTAPLELPGSVVTRFELHGPEWFAGVIDVLGLRMLPLQQELDVPIRVVLKTDSARTLVQPTAVRARVSEGAKGAQLALLVVPGVELTFFFDRQAAETGNLDFQVSLEGLTGSAAKRALKFLSAMSSASTLTLEIGGQRPFAIKFAGPNPPPAATLVELAEDLTIIEEELGVEFAFPAVGPRNYERIWIRVIRRVLQGEASYAPGQDTLNFTVTPPLPTEQEAWLVEKGSSFGVHVDDWEYEILGQKNIIDDVVFAVFNGHVVDGPEHLNALQTDRGTSRQVQFAPLDALSGVVLFGKARRDPNVLVKPVPWNIHGIEEEHDFEN